MGDDKNNSQKRSVAVKICINDILSSEYVKENGWIPNYISTLRGQVSRANVIGLVVSKDAETKGLMIDDSTGTISVRSFENKEMLMTPKIGQMVLIVGRPREYNNDKYILAEIVRVLDDKAWFSVRRKELEIDALVSVPKKEELKDEDFVELKNVKKEPVIEKKDEVTLQPQSNPYEVVLGLIKSMDTGFGVSFEEIIFNSKMKNAEDIIQSLIEEGEIFEIRPGILKVL